MYHLGYVHRSLDVVNPAQVWPKNDSIRSKRLKELHCSQSVRVAGRDIHGAPPIFNVVMCESGTISDLDDLGMAQSFSPSSDNKNYLACASIGKLAISSASSSNF